MDFGITLTFFVTAILVVLGVEIFVCLGIGTIFFTLLTGTMPLQNIGLMAFSGLDVFPLLALPLYILTGDLISEGGISRLLVEFAKSAVGWIRGGLLITTLWAAEGFAAISGSNTATVAAMGRMMLPELKEDGYPDDFAAGTVACCGTVGIITPPSIVLILYGVTSGVPVGDLFVGGLFPGLVMVTAMSLTAFLVCSIKGLGTTTTFNFKALMLGAWRSKLPFGATAIILGGIYGGVFTPTEAAAVAVIYCFLGGFFVTKKLELKKLPHVAESSAGITGMIAPIIVMALIFSENLAVLRLPEIGAKFLLGLSANPNHCDGNNHSHPHHRRVYHGSRPECPHFNSALSAGGDKYGVSSCTLRNYNDRHPRHWIRDATYRSKPFCCEQHHGHRHFSDCPAGRSLYYCPPYRPLRYHFIPWTYHNLATE